MDEVLEQATAWRAQGRESALATVVRTSGSTPRGTGAKLLVSRDGAIVGSVSGGCVESDVAAHAVEVMTQGRPRLVSYGISDEFGIEVGLACGGSIEVLIEGLGADPYAEVATLVRQEVPVVVATAVRPEAAIGRRVVFARGEARGTLGDTVLDRSVQEKVPELIRSGQSRSMRFKDQSGEETEVFLDAYPAPPTLFIFGGVHVAIPLTRYAKILGFRVNVIDPRGIFATPERFAEADELAITYPEDYLSRVELNENSYVVVLTHDPRHDEPILKRVVGSRASYVGAIGSRKTNQERMARLMAQGVPQEQLARVHAPVGMDIGAQTPEEIALAIMAEIIAARYGKAGAPMREVSGAFVG
jgi:xanthine dehydrogenase accessory factor